MPRYDRDDAGRYDHESRHGSGGGGGRRRDYRPRRPRRHAPRSQGHAPHVDVKRQVAVQNIFQAISERELWALFEYFGEIDRIGTGARSWGALSQRCGHCRLYGS